MAYYLVTSAAKPDTLDHLRGRLDNGEIRAMRPFGRALDESLRGARLQADGRVAWEENDYCTPPLAMERDAVLDDYFDDITVETVERGEGWARLASLPSLWARV